MIVAADERQDVGEELLEKVLEALRARWSWSAASADQLRRRPTAHHRLVAEPGPPINQQVHRPVTEPSHGLGVEPKWILVHTLPPRAGLAKDRISPGQPPPAESWLQSRIEDRPA